VVGAGRRAADPPPPVVAWRMRRREQRIFHLNDEVAAIRGDEERAAAELSVLMHLDDDAKRDAAVGNAIDRADARESAGDVERMQRHLAELRLGRQRLEAKRDRLLGKLDRRV
jgi:hypothetical protein